MKIAFLVNEVAGGWLPTDERLGGTEESIVRWAEEFVRMGNQVTVWHNARHNQYSQHNGVFYLPRDRYQTESDKSDVCINLKSSEVAPKEPTVYLTNETDAGQKDLSKYLGVIWPSQYAEETIPVNNSRRFIVPHGYDDTKIYPKEKVSKQCLYASSPDRGLANLERIWPAVIEQHPDAQLIVTYGGQINTPNTTCGSFTEAEMNELYNTSDFWLHPMTESGIELYCISGKKAQAAGAIPVVIPRMALKETVKTGYLAKDELDFYHKLVEALASDNEELRKRVIANANAPNWEQSTKSLLEVIQSVM